MNFVCIVFELGDKMLTLSSMETLIVQCNLVRALPGQNRLVGVERWVRRPFGLRPGVPPPGI